MSRPMFTLPAHFARAGVAARFAKVSPSRQAELARAYWALPEYDPAALPAYAALREETLRQLDELMAAGLTVDVVGQDPYGSAAEMMADVRDNGHIAVLSTAVTGSHPVLSNGDNDAFRAVHDVLGHFATGRGLDRHGEEAAFLSHRQSYSPLALPALASETRGQNAALIHSVDGATFDVQRAALLPSWWSAADALAPQGVEEQTATAFQALKFQLDAGLPVPTS